MILISGISKGIGKFLFNEFKKRGENVVGFSRTMFSDSDKIDSNSCGLDATDEESIINFVNETKLENINYIHCAGTNYNSLVTKFDKKEWNGVVNSNLNSAFLMAKHVLPIMLKNGFGRIIFCSSVVPRLGVPGTAAYSASKAALWGLMKTIASEYANKNITCNSLNLGYFNIGMINEVPEAILQKVVDRIPMKKLGDPYDIYRAVNFLLECGYITGACLDVNGGLI